MSLSISRDLVRIQTQCLLAWARAWDSALLRGLLVTLMLFVHKADSPLRGKDIGDMPAARQRDLTRLAGMFIFSVSLCLPLRGQHLRVTVL